jgi:hypothetical protein
MHIGTPISKDQRFSAKQPGGGQALGSGIYKMDVDFEPV